MNRNEMLLNSINEVSAKANAEGTVLLENDGMLPLKKVKRLRFSEGFAEKILDRNFSKVAELINHAYKEYDCDGKVILSGGITKNKEILEKFLKNKVDSEIELRFPDMPQVYGACRKCCNAFSDMEDEFEENFKNDYVSIVINDEKSLKME